MESINVNYDKAINKSDKSYIIEPIPQEQYPVQCFFENAKNIHRNVISGINFLLATSRAFFTINKVNASSEKSIMNIVELVIRTCEPLLNVSFNEMDPRAILTAFRRSKGQFEIDANGKSFMRLFNREHEGKPIWILEGKNDYCLMLYAGLIVRTHFKNNNNELGAIDQLFYFSEEHEIRMVKIENGFAGVKSLLSDPQFNKGYDRFSQALELFEKCGKNWHSNNLLPETWTINILFTADIADQSMTLEKLWQEKYLVIVNKSDASQEEKMIAIIEFVQALYIIKYCIDREIIYGKILLPVLFHLYGITMFYDFEMEDSLTLLKNQIENIGKISNEDIVKKYRLCQLNPTVEGAIMDRLVYIKSLQEIMAMGVQTSTDHKFYETFAEILNFSKGLIAAGYKKCEKVVVDLEEMMTDTLYNIARDCNELTHNNQINFNQKCTDIQSLCKSTSFGMMLRRSCVNENWISITRILLENYQVLSINLWESGKQGTALDIATKNNNKEAVKLLQQLLN